MNREKIQLALRQAEFIGEAFPSNLEKANQKNYRVGDKFLQLITFLGCSPNIKLAPDFENDDDYCFVVMNERSDRLQFRSLSNDVFARCPKCKKKLPQWSNWLKQWGESSEIIEVECEHCRSNFSLLEINWRHNAAFSHVFIDVWNIYPHEAIPSEELLAILSSAFGIEWDYFFSD